MTYQQELKDKLFQNSISRMEFLQKMLELDQATLNHKECYENIKIMELPEIKKLYDLSNEEERYCYYHYLRLFYFHAFQDEACENGTTTLSLEYLDKANNLSQVIDNILPNEDPLFSKYVSGTLCYMKNDIENLKIVIKDYEMGDKNDLTYSNINVLKRLYEGLISNKSIDYKRDYLLKI